MKKWKMAAVIVLCLFVATVSFNRNEVSVYAYTQEEIDAAKAWLEANGYSPTRAGAEQAYQDYLNGKFGPVGGTEETQAPAATEALPTETSVETQADENVEVVIETGAVVEPLTVETVETVSEETTTEQEEMMMESSSEEESTSEVLEEVSSADMVDETGTEIESSSESEEATEGFIRVGRYDGVIVVIAMAACAAMGYFTYSYVKKEKKDGE